MARNEIRKAYVRRYTDSGQVTAYVEWTDGSRTEGPVGPCQCCGQGSADYMDSHMARLFDRAKREGLTIGSEVW